MLTREKDKHYIVPFPAHQGKGYIFHGVFPYSENIRINIPWFLSLLSREKDKYSIVPFPAHQEKDKYSMVSFPA